MSHLQSLRLDGTRVSYRGEIATLTLLPDQRIALTFDNAACATLIKPIREAEADLGKNLHFIEKGKEPAPNRLDLSIYDLEEVKRREAYIKELRRASRKGGCGGVKLRKTIIARVARAIGDRNPISPAQLARWYTRAQTHSQGVVATLKKPYRNRDTNFPQDVRDLALEVIDDYYLVAGSPTVQYAYDCFCMEFEERFGKDQVRPCRETFRKWIKELDPIEVIRAREGKRAARAASRNAKSRTPVSRILERVEADALNLALGVVNERGVYLGMVTLFFVLDCYSRSVLGLQIQVGRGESSGAVIDSFRHAICPKSQDELPAGVLSDWIMYGSWEMAVADGGTGYTSRETQCFVLDASCDLQIVETHSGWRKPFIERFFLTLRSHFAKSLKSYCGKYTDRLNLDATVQEKATMTLDEFRAVLIKWIVDEYHHAPHKGLDGKTPYQVWTESAKDFPPQLPANFDRIRMAKGNVRTCAVQGQDNHQGVVIGNIHYNDSGKRLKTIGQRLRVSQGDSLVQVRYSDNDLYSVIVVDPFEDEEFEAFATDPCVRPGMCRAEYVALKPKTYRDKGFGRTRVLKDHPTLVAANDAHDQKMKRLSRKSKPASTEELTDRVLSLRQDDETPIDGDGSATPDTTSARSNPTDKPRIFGSEEGFDYE